VHEEASERDWAIFRPDDEDCGGLGKGHGGTVEYEQGASGRVGACRGSKREDATQIQECDVDQAVSD